MSEYKKETKCTVEFETSGEYILTGIEMCRYFSWEIGAKILKVISSNCQFKLNEG